MKLHTMFRALAVLMLFLLLFTSCAPAEPVITDHLVLQDYAAKNPLPSAPVSLSGVTPANHLIEALRIPEDARFFILSAGYGQILCLVWHNGISSLRLLDTETLAWVQIAEMPQEQGTPHHREFQGQVGDGCVLYGALVSLAADEDPLTEPIENIVYLYRNGVSTPVLRSSNYPGVDALYILTGDYNNGTSFVVQGGEKFKEPGSNRITFSSYRYFGIDSGGRISNLGSFRYTAIFSADLRDSAYIDSSAQPDPVLYRKHADGTLSAYPILNGNGYIYILPFFFGDSLLIVCPGENSRRLILYPPNGEPTILTTIIPVGLFVQSSNRDVLLACDSYRRTLFVATPLRGISFNKIDLANYYTTDDMLFICIPMGDDVFLLYNANSRTAIIVRPSDILC